MTAHTIDTPAHPDLLAEINAEGGIGLAQIGDVLAHLGSVLRDARRNPSATSRLITRGIRLPDGRRLRMPALRIAGRWVTSRSAVLRWVASQQPTPDNAPVVTSPAARHKAADAAERELDALGCR